MGNKFDWAWQDQRALGLVGFPSERDFANMASSNMIYNFSVTPNNVTIVNNIISATYPP